MDAILAKLNSLFLLIPGGDQLWTVTIFILVLSVLVFVHELGHYLAARSIGVDCDEFSIGFGRELFGWNDKNGMRWKFSLVPLGGYVKIFGWDESELKGVSAARRERAYNSKSVWQRMWVVLAGPGANFLFAFVALIGLMLMGEQKMLPEVGEIIVDTPAAEAGMMEGDLVLALDGKLLATWDDLVSGIVASDGNEIKLTIERNNSQVILSLTPEVRERLNHLGEKIRVPFAGIAPSYATFEVEHPAGNAIVLAAEKTYYYTATTLSAFGKIITGSISKENLGGPIMIAQVSAKAAEQGIYPLILFMVIISINLGIINLFPVPVLDGGHLLFYIVEAIKGSPVSDKVQEYGTRAGMAAVIVLMTIAIGNDILRLIKSDNYEKTEVVQEEPVRP